MPVQLMDQSVAGAWLRDWRPKGNPRHTFVAHPSAAHCQMHSESLGTAPGVTALAALAAHTGEPTHGCHTQTQTPALHRTPAHPLWAEGNLAVSAPGNAPSQSALNVSPLRAPGNCSGQEPPPGRDSPLPVPPHPHSPQGRLSMSLSCVQAAASWFWPISLHMLKHSAIMLCFSLSPGRQRLV